MIVWIVGGGAYTEAKIFPYLTIRSLCRNSAMSFLSSSGIDLVLKKRSAI